VARPSNTEERRRQIVEAMIRVMARRGYANASVAAIAEEAGLTPGLVHYHFRNKREVLFALIERLARKVGERYDAMAAEAARPRERVMAFVDAHLARGPAADPDAVACWVAVGAVALADPAVREAYAQVVRRQVDRLDALVRETLEAEGGRVEEAPRLAGGLFAAVEGAFRLAVIGPGLVPEGSAAETVREMARGLLAAAGAEEDG
jgi:TetR/AcrR family transcriptional repressor of bet genes